MPRKRVSSTNPGPGRPTAARVAAINRTILAVARTELVESGYDAARMEVIASNAGVSKGTLYDRYPTKEALLRAVIADRVAAWSEDWAPRRGPMPADLRQRLKHRAHGLMEYSCSGKLDELEKLFSASPATLELRRMRHEVGHTRVVQVIAQDIMDGSDRRVIGPVAAKRVAELLLAMLYGWWQVHQRVRHITLKEALAHVDYSVDVLLEGRSAWARVPSDK